MSKIIFICFMLISTTSVIAKEPLNIYVAGSFTGIMPFLAKGIEKSVLKFSENVNSRGGLLGRKIVIIIQDDKANINLADLNAQKAINDPNHLLTIGQPFSSLASPIGKLYADRKKLFFTPYATSNEVTKIGGTVFQLCFNDNMQGQVLAEIAYKKFKAKKIMVLVNKSDLYSDGLATEFISSLKIIDKKKITLIKDYSYIFDKIDLNNLVLQIKKYNPDLIFLPEIKVRVAEILRTLIKEGINETTILGGDGWGSEEHTHEVFFRGIENYKKPKIFFTYHWHSSIPNDQNKILSKRLSSPNGERPYGPGMISFEALLELEKKILKLKSFDNEKLAYALHGHKFLGSTGEIEYTKTDGTKRSLVLIQLLENSLKYISLTGERGL
jgi:branched-chain amino acid transport system substrate-binding protein